MTIKNDSIRVMYLEENVLAVVFTPTVGKEITVRFTYNGGE